MIFSTVTSVPGKRWPWGLMGKSFGRLRRACEIGVGLSQDFEDGKVGLDVGALAQVGAPDSAAGGLE